MLVLPIFNRSHEKKLPWCCLALIIVNSLIFFFLQSNDGNIEKRAWEYYLSSGLVNMEVEAYREYRNKQETPSLPVASPKSREYERQIQLMLRDEEFQYLIHQNRIFSPSTEQYKTWREKRDVLEEMQTRSVTRHFGYRPADHNVLGLLTSIFLHGSTMHLVGNMIFLWMVGAILEKAIGPLFFTVLYLFTGVCAALAFGLVNPHSLGPLIGASGAISGLMGGYTIIFGLRRIKIFYSLGFYFNYARVPAIALFPVWLLTEIFRLYFNEHSQVAYMAHIGGLVSGIGFAATFRWCRKSLIDDLFVEDEREEKIAALLESGTRHMVALEMEKARQDYTALLKIDPGNMTGIRQLFHIDKTNPESSQFHKSAHRLLEKLAATPTDDYLEIFAEYRSATSKVQLTPAILEQLAFRYLKKNLPEKAAPAISQLLKKYPQNAKIPGFLVSLANVFRAAGKNRQAASCLRILRQKYPESAEALELEAKATKPRTPPIPSPT